MARILERLLIGLLIGLFAIAVAVTVYFRRRMVRDLLRPVASMHLGVAKLHSGEYEHRLVVLRRDELGELAEAFNSMALALRDSHLALTRRATHDSLTGLPNRASLLERLSASFAPGADRRARRESVLFIDVDDFKEVNDTLGHEGGDVLLVQLAARLNDCVRPGDLVTRLGGDEFAIVVADDDGTTTGQVAERILNALRQPFLINGTRLSVSVSIGVAPRRPDTTDPAELLRSADFAMYMAKGSGKDRYQTFDAQIHEDLAARSALKHDLALAVTAGNSAWTTSPSPTCAPAKSSAWRHCSAGSTPPGGCSPPQSSSTWPKRPATSPPSARGCWTPPPAKPPAGGIVGPLRGPVGLRQSLPAQSNSPTLASLRDILTDPATQPDQVVLEITETGLATDPDGGIAALTG